MISRLRLVGMAALFVAIVCVIVSVADAQNKDDAKDPKDAKKVVKPAPVVLRTQCDRESATYKIDEPAVFLLASNTGGEVECTFTADQRKVVHQTKIRVVPNQTYKIEHKLGRPGFLQLKLSQDAGDGAPGTALAVAAVEPTKIEPAAKAPEDFDEFWKAQLDALAKVRVDQLIEPWASESTPKVSVFRVNFANIDGRRVYGWLAVPKGPGPFPAIVTVPYAGVYGIQPDLYHANLGAVTLNIIIHDFPVNNPGIFYKKEAEGSLKDYNRIGWDDRDKSYFKYAILAGVRAIDYLVTRKDVDPTQIAVTGSSQGGGLSLCVSGLDPRVGFLASNVPGLCDLSALSQDRVDGWPHWVAAAPANIKEKVAATAPYFDAANFASKFKGKSILGVGFLDTACPPSTVYAAFNQLPDPKIMIDSPLMGHGTDPRWLKAREDFWKANLKLAPPPTPPVKK